MLQRRVSRDNETRLRHFIECAFMLEPQEWNELIRKYTANEVSFFAVMYIKFYYSYLSLLQYIFVKAISIHCPRTCFFL
jgi:hypothetical protein